jgi:hypothetical protein
MDLEYNEQVEGANVMTTLIGPKEILRAFNMKNKK